MFFKLVLILSAFTIMMALLWTLVLIGIKTRNNRYYDAGKKAVKKDLKDEAIQLFLKSLELNPRDTKSLLELCKLYESQNDYEKAAIRYKDLLERSFKDEAVLKAYAGFMKKTNNLEIAKDFYLKAYKIRKDSDCALNIGLINFEEKSFSEALGYFKKAAASSSKNFIAKLYIAKCEENLYEMTSFADDKKLKEILKIYKDLQKNKNIKIDAMVGAARIYAKLGKVEKTVEQCEKTLMHNPNNVECLNLLGLAYLILKKIPESKEKLNRVLKIEKNNAETHELLSFVLCQYDNRCLLKKCREQYYQIIKNLVKES